MRPKLSYFSTKLSRSITKRTTFMIVAILLATTYLGVTEIYEMSSRYAERSLDVSIQKVENVLKEIESAGEVVAANLSYNLDDEESIKSLAKSILEIDTNVVSCALAFEKHTIYPTMEHVMGYASRDSSNNVSIRMIDPREYDYFFQDWYQVPMLTGKPYWNEPSYDIDDASLTSAYSIPVFNTEKEIIGVLRIALSLDWLSELINKGRPYKSAITIILSQSGTFISHGQDYRDQIMNSTVYADAIDMGNSTHIESCKQVMSGKKGSINYPADGKIRYVQYAPLYNGWYVLGICSFADFFAPINRILLVIIIIGLIGIILQYISIKKKIKRMTTPISLLTYATMNMSRGKFNTSIPTFTSKDEIQKLASSIRLMQTSINRYIHELKTSTQTQERMESELSVASSIQLSFLPHDFPVNPEYDCYGSMTPAKSVGGDLYDFKQEDRIFRFAIGDVSGKGVPAAMFMAITKSALNFRTNKSQGTDIISEKINYYFSVNNDEGMFLTLFIAKVNLDTLEMEFCNCGHNHIIIVEPDGKARYVDCKPNIAIGVFPEFKFESEKVQLSKGCRVLAYTDGITEAENVNKELFGEQRLLEYASNLKADMTSQEVSDGLIDAVREFTAGNEQNDDMTIFTVKF